MADNIAPCPWCGGKATLEGEYECEDGIWWDVVECLDVQTDCYARGPWRRTPAEAIAEWNRVAAIVADAAAERQKA